MKKVLATTLLAAMITVPVSATPSTLIWVPSTDLQTQGTWHLGIDDYFTSNNGQFPTDIGLTYGFKGGEVGIDYLASQDKPLYFNFKFNLVDDADKKFKVVAGAYNIGTSSETNAEVKYVLASKTTKDGTRFSLGYGVGREEVLGDDDNNMVIAGIDKMFNDKWWGAIDYQSGDSALGALSFGVSYNFAPNVSVIFGYDIFNNKAYDNTFTTQLDINF